MVSSPDPAAGSGGQLAAYGEKLRRDCVGVELSPRRAVHCANSLTRLEGGSAALAICGDGLDSEGVMALVHEKIGDVKVAMLHVDPAVPFGCAKSLHFRNGASSETSARSMVRLP